MAITLTKVKPVVELPAILSDGDYDLKAQIDLVGSHQNDVAKIKKQIKELTAKLKPYAEAESKLQAMVDELELGDDEEDTVSGERFRVEIGPRGNKRSIPDMAKVKAALGDLLFMKLATVTLKNLDDYLNPEQRGEVIKTDRTSRSIKLEKV